MTVIKFPPGTNIDDLFGIIELLAKEVPQTGEAMAKTIETLANSALDSDRMLLQLITALIAKVQTLEDKVQVLEEIEKTRFEQYVALVDRQDQLAKQAIKAVDQLELLAKQYFAQSKKDVH